MGDQYQVEWVRSLLPLHGPVLEVGSLRVPDSPWFFDYRALFPDGTPYDGVDIKAGLGVDLVCDIADETFHPPHAYQTILCLSTLEHVRHPWKLADRMAALLAPGGMLVVSAPFVWILHDFPDDYWRFSPLGIQALFPSIVFDPAHSTLTTVSGRRLRLSEDLSPLRYPCVIYGTSGMNGVTYSDAYIVQPGSFIGEGVNVNMVGTKNGHQ